MTQYTAADLAKVAIALYAAETMALAAQGEAQTAWPEAFVPGAVRLMDESLKAVTDPDGYLAAHPRAEALPENPEGNTDAGLQLVGDEGPSGPEPAGEEPR